MKPVCRCLMLFAAITASPALQQTRTVNPGNPSTLEDFKAGDEHREPYQRASDLVAALHVSPGDWVADIGAGAGYYSMRLGELAGPQGKVFAEDISSASQAWLNLRIKLFNLRNVEIVRGDVDDPKLPAGRLAAVLVVDSYHHFTNYQTMLEKILQALKPGGRLAIADYSSTGHRTLPRAEQLKLHEIDPGLARSEAGHAGFQFVQCDDPFVKWKAGAGNNRAAAADLWLMVLVRPN